jgi:hypothetical protein
VTPVGAADRCASTNASTAPPAPVTAGNVLATGHHPDAPIASVAERIARCTSSTAVTSVPARSSNVGLTRPIRVASGARRSRPSDRTASLSARYETSIVTRSTVSGTTRPSIVDGHGVTDGDTECVQCHRQLRLAAEPMRPDDADARVAAHAGVGVGDGRAVDDDPTVDDRACRVRQLGMALLEQAGERDEARPAGRGHGRSSGCSIRVGVERRGGPRATAWGAPNDAAPSAAAPVPSAAQRTYQNDVMRSPVRANRTAWATVPGRLVRAPSR